MPKAACKMDTTPSVKFGKSSHDFISGFDVLNASVAEYRLNAWISRQHRTTQFGWAKAESHYIRGPGCISSCTSSRA